MRVGVAGMRGAVNIFPPHSPGDMTEEAEAGVVLAMMVSPARLAVVARVREQSDIRVHWPVGRWTRRRRPSLCRQIRQAVPPLEKPRGTGHRFPFVFIFFERLFPFVFLLRSPFYYVPLVPD